MKRESFRSRLGFLLVSAGCAIGIGNVWRFPYVTGKNGGGYFVLFYILCLLIMGVPVLTMELAVGRASHKSAILAYKTLEKPKSKWHIHGWFCLIGCYLLMMYYTTVSGWMVSYFGRFLTGKFYSGMPAEDASAVFGQLLSDPVEMGILAVAIVIVGFIVCSFGLQKGLERVSKVMMIALLALILILAVHSLTLSGAAEGMKFYLLPSMDSIRENGLRSLITDAMNQAFFTLSLGIAAMEIFGSYMSDDHALAGESIRICALDTFVADLVDSQTNASMTREEMLRAVYEYVRDHYLYLKRSLYEVVETGWEIPEALLMFQSGKGNCYNFTAAFWSLARGIGFDAVCYSGLVGVGRDPHSWVEITFDGVPYVFDVETEMSYRLVNDYITSMYWKTYEEVAAWSYVRTPEKAAATAPETAG